MFTTNDLVRQYIDSKIICSPYLSVKKKEIHDTEQKLCDVFLKMVDFGILGDDIDFKAIVTEKNMIRR